MKNSFILFIVSCCLASCNGFIEISQSPDYTIDNTGVDGISMLKNDSASLAIFAKLLSGDPTKEYITATLSDVPNNVSIDSNNYSFRPNFTAIMKLRSLGASHGDHLMHLRVQTTTNGTKAYPINLKILDSTDCYYTLVKGKLNPIEGQYSAINHQMSGSLNSMATIRYVQPNKIIFYIKNDPTYYNAIEAIADCGTQTIIIYPQERSGYGDSVKGSGYWSKLNDTTANVFLRYTLYYGSKIVDTCNVSMY